MKTYLFLRIRLSIQVCQKLIINDLQENIIQANKTLWTIDYGLWTDNALQSNDFYL